MGGGGNWGGGIVIGPTGPGSVTMGGGGTGGSGKEGITGTPGIDRGKPCVGVTRPARSGLLRVQFLEGSCYLGA